MFCLQIRKTLFDSASTVTPYGATVADVANAIASLRASLTIAVDPSTAPAGDDQGITTASGVSFLSWGPCSLGRVSDAFLPAAKDALHCMTAESELFTLGASLWTCDCMADEEGGPLDPCIGDPVRTLQRTCSQLAAQVALWRPAGLLQEPAASSAAT